MRICFDMDGTIANFYGVAGWLESLKAEDVKPYREAKALLNFSALAKALNKAQRNGNKLVIISWTSKNGSDKFNEAVAVVKREWLAKHLPSVRWDEVNIVKYGHNKAEFAKAEDAILFDDEEPNRNGWTGKAYEPSEILAVLKNL